jgi:hypothetical protein
VLGGLALVAQAILGDLGDAAQDRGGGVADRRGRQPLAQHLDQLAPLLVALVPALERVEGLGVAGLGVEHLLVEPRRLGEVAHLGGSDAGRPAQRLEPALVVADERRPLLVDREQPRPVVLLRVDRLEEFHRGVVVGIDLDHPGVGRGRGVSLAQVLELDLAPAGVEIR